MVCQAAWGNVIPFCGHWEGEETHFQVPKWAQLGEATMQPVGARGGNEWDSEDVTFSDSEDGED